MLPAAWSDHCKKSNCASKKVLGILYPTSIERHVTFAYQPDTLEMEVASGTACGKEDAAWDSAEISTNEKNLMESEELSERGSLKSL